MIITFADVKATTQLPDVFYCSLFNLLGLPETPDDTDAVEHRAALLAWIGDLSRKIRFDAETVQVILRHTASLADAVAIDSPAPAINTAIGKYQIAILDGRYLAYTGATQLIDLKTGRPAQNHITSLESIAYDIGVLWSRKLVEVRTRHAQKSGLDGSS